jgi:hypothetical protein
VQVPCGQGVALIHSKVARLLPVRVGLKRAEREENVWETFLVK